MKRAARFFMHWITLRSFSSAVWVNQYEQFNPTHGK